RAGLDFNAGSPPEPIFVSMDDHQPFNIAAASVCDTSGALLFYTGGDFVYDRNNNLMPNGSHLTPFSPVRYKRVYVNGQYTQVVDSSFSYTGGASQGALIVPFPDQPNKYYIFSIRTADHPTASNLDPLSGKLYYSVVDMRLNGGMGDVVPGEKG